jgi:hypothetical protein
LVLNTEPKMMAMATSDVTFGMKYATRYAEKPTGNAQNAAKMR